MPEPDESVSESETATAPVGEMRSPGPLRRWWRSPRKRAFLLLAGAGLLVAALTPVIILVRTFAVVHADRLPALRPESAIAEVQTEAFTCGMHAVRTIERAYGLDPDAERVRWRLGVDTKALFWLSDSTGALHPDVYMVLRQDGFAVRSIAFEEGDPHGEILAHLATGHLALLLIERRETGGLHWVVAQEREVAPDEAAGAERYTVIDSLLAAPAVEGRAFTEAHVLSALAVEPSGDLRTGFRESLGALIEGTRELGAFESRRRALKGSRVPREAPR